MRTPCTSALVRVGSALALVFVLAGCTKGGQFDPTELLNSDMLDSKKKLQGQREPVFPNGVPGTSTGVPPELVKGYQPPPDQAADNGDTAAAPPEPAKPEAKPKAKPKPKPKPQVAHAPPPPRTQINVGLAPRPAAPAPAQSSDSIWPAAPSTAPAQNVAQPQSIWPNPPAPSTPSQ